MIENNETMKIAIQESDKMLAQELEESVSLYWSTLSRSLRILLLSIALGLGVLSMVLVMVLVMAVLN